MGRDPTHTGQSVSTRWHTVLILLKYEFFSFICDKIEHMIVTECRVQRGLNEGKVCVVATP